jgi:hypothetical protein
LKLNLLPKTEIAPDWRKALILSWKSFRESVGRPCDLGWGVLKNRISQMRKVVDEDTGEIFIEEIGPERWERQLEGFRRDEYAKKAEYPFGLFQTQFGSYNPPMKPKKLEQPKAQLYWCEVCKKNHVVGGEDEKKCVG